MYDLSLAVDLINHSQGLVSCSIFQWIDCCLHVEQDSKTRLRFKGPKSDLDLQTQTQRNAQGLCIADTAGRQICYSGTCSWERLTQQWTFIEGVLRMADETIQRIISGRYSWVRRWFWYKFDKDLGNKFARIWGLVEPGFWNESDQDSGTISTRTWKIIQSWFGNERN